MKYTGNLNLKKPEGTDIVNIDDLNENADILDLAVAGKVDKVVGKGLSEENFTAAEKNKLAGIATGANNYTHPANHPASIIIQDASNRFVTDTEKANWNAKETPTGAQTKVDTHANNTTTAHGATSAATANKIIIRDVAGRAKVAAPSAADDIARKDTVDAVQTNLSAHLADGTSHGIGNKATLLTTDKSIVGAINELFTSAGSGKVSVATAIGSPALATEDFNTLANHIATGKNQIATALTNKGVAASGSDTFAQLASGISSAGVSIKSIQRGVVGYVNISSTIAVNINKVDLSKSIVLVSFAPNASFFYLTAKFINDSTLEFYSPSNSSVKFSWQVIEFSGNVFVQSGQTSTTTVNISKVDLSKSFLCFTSSPTTVTAFNYGQFLGYFYSDSQLRFESRDGSSFTACWFVVTFN